MKHLFFGIQTFSILLLLGGCGGDDSTSSQPEPQASFTVSGTTITPATLTFNNTSVDADHYLWDFGDGKVSIQTSPSMTFTTFGSYEITLVATRSSSNHSDTARQEITITPGQVFLDTIRVEQIPFVNGGGAGWDLTTGPDLYFDLVQFTTTLQTSAEFPVNDVTPAQLPVYWFSIPEYRLLDWQNSYFINLYDYDSGSANDFVGSASFIVNSLIAQNDYQRSFTLENSQHTVRIKISLRWQ